MQKAKRLISELGGKHGLLELFPDHTVKTELIKSDQSFTDKQIQRVQQRCSDLGVETVIIRTSDASDYRHMVDAMPTNRNVAIADIPRSVEDIKAKIFAPELIAYSKKEGSDYHPKNVTISLTPQLGKAFGTVTEHPNQPDVLMLDFREAPGFSTESSSLIETEILHSQPKYWNFSSEQEIAAYDLMQKIRNSGEFSEKEAQQIEFGIHPKTAEIILFQIRQFSKFNLGTQKLHDWRKNISRSTRVFGVTGGLNLPVERSGNRLDGINSGDSKKSPYLLFPSNIRNDLTLDEYPKHMQAYIGNSIALSHQNTRLVKLCLERDGVAFLRNHADDSYWSGREAQPTRYDIASDGYTHSIESDTSIIEEDDAVVLARLEAEIAASKAKS